LQSAPPRDTMRDMSAFSHLPDVEPLQIWEGVVGRVVQGERVTMALIELAAGCVIPEHRHHNEQLGVCITGSLRFRIGDETRDIGPGDGWRIRGDVPHQVETGVDGAVVLESFAPVRSDWDGLERLPATGADLFSPPGRRESD
jgi:quercetin dioxygenase-like cupin family protein